MTFLVFYVLYTLVLINLQNDAGFVSIWRLISVLGFSVQLSQLLASGYMKESACDARITAFMPALIVYKRVDRSAVFI